MHVVPFTGVRPVRDKVHLVASRSYVGYSKKQLREKLQGNPYSFLHIIHPDLGSRQLHRITNNIARFRKVREKYHDFIQQGILQRDPQPAFYLYRQTKGNHVFLGVIAAVDLNEYVQGQIKGHEHTLSRRQETFTAYLETTAINAEPVLLFHRHDPALEDIYARYTAGRPEYEFTQTTTVRHELWLIADEEGIGAVSRCFQALPFLYIADGHHRIASSAQLRERASTHNRTPEMDYCMAMLMSESRIRISAFHRLVSDLNGLTPESFLHTLRRQFEVAVLPESPAETGIDRLLVYLDHRWYSLTPLKPSAHQLAVRCLNEMILAPVLGIHDPRKDQRLTHAEGPLGIDYLKKQVDSKKYAVAFALPAVQADALKQVADAGEFMPPKSTWIEPKLRSGLVIYELS